MKRLRKKLPEKEYEKPEGAMRALRKTDSEPGYGERELLRRLFRHSPVLKTAYELREELTYISDRGISEDKALREIGIRCRVARLHGMKLSENFLSASEKHTEEITDYFTGRLTGGSAEGSDNKIRVIRHRCYGISDITHLFRRIFTDTEGYSLFGYRGNI